MGMLEDLAKLQMEYERGEISYPERSAYMLQRGVTQPTYETMGSVISLFSPFIDSAKWLASDLTPDFIEQPILDTADYVSRMNKKAYDAMVPERGQRMLSAAGDFLGLTPMGRMARLDPSMRGLHTSSGDVIIPNFYDPNAKGYPKYIEEMLQEIAPDKGKMNAYEEGKPWRGEYFGDNRLQNKIRAGLGFTEWGTKGVGRMLRNIFDPKQRAMYAEYGVSPSFKVAMDRVEQLVDEGKKFNSSELRNAVEVAHSQMQQMKNIRVQAEAKARKKDATDPFGLEASDPSSPAFFNPKEAGDNWYYETGAKGATQRGINLSESNFVQNYFKDTWLPDENMDNVRVIVKRPRSVVTGDHYTDLLARNSKLKHALGVFEGWNKGKGKRDTPEFESLDDLETALRAQSDKFVRRKGAEINKKTAANKADPNVDMNKGRERAFTVIGKRDGGVWIKGSRAGRAKVEGGVNMLFKIEPNGNITGYMSDLHDFLEKTPVLGPTLDAALPKKVLAVSPPMQTNVYSLYTAESNKRGVYKEGKTKEIYGDYGVERRLDHPSYPVDEFQDALDRLREVSALQPSKAEIGRQALQSAGNLSLFGNVMGNRTTPSEMNDYVRNLLGQASYEDTMMAP